MEPLRCKHNFVSDGRGSHYCVKCDWDALCVFEIINNDTPTKETAIVLKECSVCKCKNIFNKF